jgi:hypothetical protein
MAAGALFAMVLPGLAILLVVLAVAEHAWSRHGRRSPLRRRERHALSAGGMEMARDDVDDGAPPYGRIDLDGGVAYLDVR